MLAVSLVTIGIALVAVVVLILIMGFIGSLYRRVGPNRALIVYGSGGTHIVTGGGKVVWPLFQSCQELSLELMSFDVAPEQDLYTAAGRRRGGRGRRPDQGQVRPGEHPDRGRAVPDQAAEEREALIRLVMEGHLRGIVGLLTVEQIVKEPEMVAGRVRRRRRRPDQDGPRGRLVHDQAGHRRERLHHQHGPPGRGADQARGRHRGRRGRARHRYQAARWRRARRPSLRPRPIRSA